MCLIIGSINSNIEIKNILNVLEKLKYRGNDNFGITYTLLTENKLDFETIYNKDLNELKKQINEKINKGKLNQKSRNQFKKNKTSDFIFTHSLLSLVNFVEQPLIKNDNIFITNCEIYNWKELDEKYNLNSKNDADLLFKFLELKFKENKNSNNKNQYNLDNIFDELDGVYAFAYYRKEENNIYLVRDILGVKPLFYNYNEEEKSFNFISEKKGLNILDKDLNSKYTKELDPKEILIYNLNSKNIEIVKRKFWKLEKEKELKQDYKKIKKETKKLLIEAIKKRIPNKKHKIGVLFSGGIDSTFIAYNLMKLGIDFTCYTAKLEGGNIQEAEDLIYAKEIAKKYNFKLKIAKININQLDKKIKKVINIIEDKDHIKVAVALPFLISLEEAKKENIKIIFSGLGSEEIFAGYNRHKKAENPNQECINGLSILHIRDLYRDDTITMSQNMELRLPFLDKELINYTLKIPVKYKLNLEKKRSKIILRNIANEIGIDLKYSERAKKAAQYGSKFDKGILRLAKNKKLQKQDYINQEF